MYDDYFIKLKLITEYIELREEDLLSVKQYRLLMSAYINEVAEELNFQTFLENYSDTQNLWEIFNYYRREDTYKNDNIISDNLETNEELLEYAGWLMTYAKKELLKMGTPQYAISTDLNNLLALPEFKPIIEDFEVGNWIHIRTDVRDDIEEEIIYKLRLLSYQINFDEIQSIDVEFSNVVRTIDCMSDMKSILDSAQSMATSYNSVYKEVDKSKETNEIVSTWVNDSLDLTNQLIKTEGNDQSITIDEHGILARKCDTLTREYDSHQLKIFSNGLYFTPDNWETIKAGVGKFVYKDPNEGFAEKIGYGVIADTIVSNIVCTNELGIYNEEGSVKIDGEGISITNGEITIGDTTSDTYAKITKDGILYASGGEFSGKIKATRGTIGGWCIEQEYIINKNENIYKYFKLDIDSGIDILDANNSKRTVISTDGWIRQVGSDGLVEITNGGIGFYNNTLEWEIEVKEAVVGGTGEGSVEIVAVEDFDLSKQYMSIFPSVYSTVDNMKGMIFQTNTESDFVSFTKNYGDGQNHKVVMDFSDNATAMFNVYGTSTFNDASTFNGTSTFNSSITLSEDFGGEIGKKVSTLTVACYEDGNYFLYCNSPFTSPYLTVNNAFNLGNFEDGSGNKYINAFYTVINAAKDCVRMGVIQDGWIGQGIKWDVYGNLTIDGYATTSDERLKNSFESLEKFDDVFMKLNPTTFKYNNDTSSKIHFGFKAQNIEDVLNSHGFNADDFFILSKTKKHELSEDYNGYDVELGLSYQEFTAWNTHMIQKCIEENNKLKNKIQELYNKINDLQGIV